jgi:hypothetical protein
LSLVVGESASEVEALTLSFFATALISVTFVETSDVGIGHTTRTVRGGPLASSSTCVASEFWTIAQSAIIGTATTSDSLERSGGEDARSSSSQEMR